MVYPSGKPTSRQKPQGVAHVLVPAAPHTPEAPTYGVPRPDAPRTAWAQALLTAWRGAPSTARLLGSAPPSVRRRRVVPSLPRRRWSMAPGSRPPLSMLGRGHWRTS
jgi:hypothetical protein